MKIFWSWQSDNPQNAGRYFVRDVLKELADELSTIDGTMEAERPESGGKAKVELDHDTLGVAGSPHIADTILKKIREAAVFVADVTPIDSTTGGKRLPNPNVMLELGYALSELGNARIVLVMNSAAGGKLDHLPFDLRHLRAPVHYSLRKDADEKFRSEVAKSLKNTLRERIMPSLLVAAEAAMEKLRRLNRGPLLSVELSENNNQPHLISLEAPSPDVPSMNEIEKQTPLLSPPQPTKNASVKLHVSAVPNKSPLASLGKAPPVSQWGLKDIEAYNNRVKGYYRTYQKFLTERIEFDKLINRSVALKFRVFNKGSMPATGITVQVDFPQGVLLYGDGDYPKSPTPPEPPELRPGNYVKITSVQPPRYDQFLETRFSDTMSINAEARRVEFYLSELIHHEDEEIDDIVVTFASDEEVKSFAIRYLIRAREIPEPAEGSIDFEVKLSEI